MYLHHSTRTEDLVRVLAEVVAEPLPDPIRPECIVVQGRGMERWVSMELSQRLGVWANAEFPLPRRIIERAFDCVLGPVDPAGIAFDPETVMWSVAALLPALIEQESFRPIRHFLADDERGTRRVQLAQRIAETLDHYLIYRPEMLRTWERGADPGWQAVLWRALVERHGPGHLASRAQAFIARLRGAAGAAPLGRGALDGFPTRVSFFGVTALPPLYVDILAALSQHVDVHLFLTGWSVPDAEGGTATHPLCLSFGRVGRELQILLEQCADVEPSGSEPRPDDYPDTLLGRLQAEIAFGRSRQITIADRPQADSGPQTDSGPQALDGSLTVHACAGPMREVEVLHDQLVARFEADPSLEPHDVVVMAPDIEAYAPFIEAVFAGTASSSGDGPTQRPRIPFRLADRRMQATHEIVDALGALLDATSGRMTATGVLDLLMIERIRSRFGIEAADLEVVAEWVRGAGIRWGVDASHRGEVGQPKLEQNTWRAGLDRLLLGYALPDEPRALFHGRLPAASTGQDGADLLGRFCDFCETLFAFRQRLDGPRHLSQWSVDLGDLLDALVMRADENVPQHELVRNALAELAASAGAAGFEGDVSLETLRSQLGSSLERAAPAAGFLSGGVTFCEIVPMRSIPFRVVVLMGLNDDAFPRDREPLGFDLTAHDHRIGDRTSRDDDRAIFLAALLSARDALLITYVGKHARDGSSRAPSVVVGELLDELEVSFGAAASGGGEIREQLRNRIVTQHPLQAFSPGYFAGEGLFSYAASECAGARALVAAQADRPPGRPYVREVLPEPRPSEGPECVELEDLIRFLEHPVRFFFQRRLGLFLGAEAPSVEDREPMELDALERWHVGDALLRYRIEGVEPGLAQALVRARSTLPPGAPGDIEADRATAGVESLLREVERLRVGQALPDLVVDGTLGAGGRWRLVGQVGALWPAGHIALQYSKLPHRRELGLWIRHLALNWAAGPETPRSSYLVGRASREPDAQVLHLPPVSDAGCLLTALLGLYDLGRRAPLPLFPRTSLTYAQMASRRDWQSGLDVGRNDWDGGGPNVGAERDEAYIHQAFRDVDPLDPAVVLPGGLGFAELTRRVYEPYLRMREVMV